MPYIPHEDREHFLPLAPAATTVGVLNFQITTLMIRYLKEHGISYSAISEARAACHDAAAELYRRVAAPYENFKIQKNGDVYDQLPKEVPWA